VGDLAADFGVFEIVEVMTVSVEDTVATKPKGLMNLKIKTDRSYVRAALFRNGSIRDKFFLWRKREENFLRGRKG
jgi:hypothetical protein